MQLDRITAVDPDSTAYHTAMRKTAAVTRAPGHFPGIKAQADAIRKKEYEAMINAGLAR